MIIHKQVLFVIFILSAAFTLEIQTKPKTYSAYDSKKNPLDLKLVQLMNYRNGIFIEVGAFDGIFSSNTKLLEEDYDWTGILVEPSANLFDVLCKNRPNSHCFQCALGSFEENNTYAYGDFDGHAMSSFTNRRDEPATYQVLIRSLQSILDECGLTHINFFSLDTEGYELNILKGIDFDKTSFDYLLIEVYNHQYQQIIEFLADKGYVMVCCLTNYNKKDNPGWDGTHNDYLFRRSTLETS